MQLTEEMIKEYETLWGTCGVRPERASTLAWYLGKIRKNQSRYEDVSAKTGVPWYVIACIHAMEASFDFGTHLHNGDPLTERTRQVPVGRPKTGTPPFTWEESAIDALAYDGASSIKDWSLARTLFFLEMYNGSGYRTGSGRATTPPMRSPYLWSFTNHYEKGKYVSDGRFEPGAISDQAGCCAILRSMEDNGMIKLSSTSSRPERQVGWFNAYLFNTDKLNEFEIGVAAKYASSDDTCATIRVRVSNPDIAKFMSLYPSAASVAIAEPTKSWPEAPTKAPQGFSREKALEMAVAECKQDISWRGNGKAKKYTKKFEPVFGTGRYSWCAAFVTWCCEQAGLNIPVKVPGDKDGYTFALCEAWQQWAIRNYFWVSRNSIPVPGDIVLFDWEGATDTDNDFEDHIGFVVKDNGDATVSCAEGNVNDATAFKTRNKSLIQGYIRIPNGYKFQI